ncbi:hypothetical protein PSEUBRA_003797 [Kalmanozyma brasiliensis GHG001]|uniref:Uncharacterized protein n=1 Tax=Kalmanozyma brasiliensis (strain GHG001) TaxID=1365824 RepID=V5ENY2_KALBG|nr:uncharacterized protein PSEUBRA_003797 [Kalmanozyma brasiliensis GHG001]EST06810.1 hypothetical protein PSEUBRA_003797 [Kalmanozyma brasiliensis GHG001]
MSGNAGDRIGGAIKGAFNAVHGVGETIRGNINDGVDAAGEGLRDASHDDRAADPSAVGRSSDYDTQGNHRGVAQEGTEEFKSGIQQMKNAFSSDSSSTNTTTGTATNTTANTST